MRVASHWRGHHDLATEHSEPWPDRLGEAGAPVWPRLPGRARQSPSKCGEFDGSVPEGVHTTRRCGKSSTASLQSVSPGRAAVAPQAAWHPPLPHNDHRGSIFALLLSTVHRALRLHNLLRTIAGALYCSP